MNKRSIIESFNCAIEGIIETIKREKHMRIHLIITILVIIFSFLVRINKYQVILISIAISLVWIAEIINTSLEAIVDIYTKEHHELAKLAKDAGAGAVFIAAVNAVVTGYLIFFKDFSKWVIYVLAKIKGSKNISYKLSLRHMMHSPWHMTVIALVLVVICVVGLKAYFRKGTPLQGGMPSGHSAVAFSIWIIIVFYTNNTSVILLTLFLALLVSQTRIKSGIHTLKEVFYGGLLGTILTYLLMKLLS